MRIADAFLGHVHEHHGSDALIHDELVLDSVVREVFYQW